MRVFEKNGKTNFVDDFNVLLGYDDVEVQCCERVGWFISYEKHDKVIKEEGKIDLRPYSFNTKYIVNTYNKYNEEEQIVRFKLEAPDKKDIYLHLYNVHNGYYRHGFEFWKEDTKLEKDSL